MEETGKSLEMTKAQKEIFARLKKDFNDLMESGVGVVADQYGDFLYFINLENVEKCWSNDDMCPEEDGTVNDVDVTYERSDVESLYVQFVATLAFSDTSFGVQFKGRGNDGH